MKTYFTQSFIFVMTALLSIAGFTACNSNNNKDAEIKAEVEKTLKSDPSEINIIADVKDGVVTLSGSCPTDKEKERATMRVETVSFVKSVVNNCTVVQKTEMTDEELNRRLYDLTKDLSTVNSIKLGAMDGVVQIAGPVKKKEWVALKEGIDKLMPKGYDTTMLDVQ